MAAWHEAIRSEEHTSELQSPQNLVCRLLLEKTERRGNFRCHCFARPATTPARPLAAARSVPPLFVSRLSRARREPWHRPRVSFFFFNDPAPTEIYPLPLHDPLPI